MDPIWYAFRYAMDWGLLPPESRDYWRLGWRSDTRSRRDPKRRAPRFRRARLNGNRRNRRRYVDSSDFDDDVRDLVDAVRDPKVREGMIESAREAFLLVDGLRNLIRWDDGLRDTLVDLILKSVGEAERFGPKTGPFKRRFVIRVVTRTLAQYPNPPVPLPLLGVVEPFVGIAVDWTVAIMNIHNAWTPVKHISVPRLFEGPSGWIWRLGSRLLDFIGQVQEFIWSNAFQRNVNDARRKLTPILEELQALIPPKSLPDIVDAFATAVNSAGELAIPHLITIDRLIRVIRTAIDVDPSGRHDLAVRALRDILEETYADSPIALGLIRSPIGNFFLNELVHGMERILFQQRVIP
jgi:hypothetical protein